MTIQTVYLVEDHARGQDTNSYWAKVYLSERKAREGVEYWAPRRGIRSLRWEDGSFGVMIAYPADDDDVMPAYKIVPLDVHQDSQPERGGTLQRD